MSDFSLDTSLAFDQTKQSAILGWCVQDDVFCMQCMSVVKAEWFSSPMVAKLYRAITDIYNRYHRKPTPQEIREYRPFTQEDAVTQKRLPEVMVECLKQTRHYGLDMLRNEMTDWMKAVIFGQGVTRAVNSYNAKKVDEAWAIMDEAGLMKSTASFEDGINVGFQPAGDGMLDERAERIEQSKHILQYGVSFLDDCLVGIIPNDLIVLGARTGAGKTQLATAIALHNARAGKQVHYFALEAENFEIQRRIKYGAISAEYYRRVPMEAPPVGYAEWRMNKIDHLLGGIEKEMGEELKEQVKNLNIRYHIKGKFDMKVLEKELLSIVGKTNLIIIDHLHYIDTNGENENKDYKDVIKLVRDIVLRYSVPVIVIAHLRKKHGGDEGRTLVPVIDDFMGTSDVPKISTTCIMLGRSEDPEHRIYAARHLWPTFIGAVKSRLDGSRTRYVGLTHFNSQSSLYQQEYALSTSIYQWDIAAGLDVPYWARGSARPAMGKK